MVAVLLPFVDVLVLIGFFVGGVERAACLIVNRKAICRTDGKGLVHDFYIALLVQHEAMGHTVIHDAKQELAGAEVQGCFVVAVADFGKLQGYYGPYGLGSSPLTYALRLSVA